MIAQNNEYMQEATQALYECNADELIRQQCFAREEYNRYQRTIKKALKDATEERDCAPATIREQETALQEKDAALQEKDAALQEQKTTIQEQNAEIARLRALLNEKP